MPILAVNKKANFDYQLLSSHEAGLMLTGPEVKSVKASHVSLKGAFVTKLERKGRLTFYLSNANISPYPYADNTDYEPTRSRQLLLHRQELLKLAHQTQESGLTLVPTKIYTKGNLVKLEFAVARGKKQHDKREAIKKRDISRQIRRELKG
jgi:SsrA-binding protein